MVPVSSPVAQCGRCIFNIRPEDATVCIRIERTEAEVLQNVRYHQSCSITSTDVKGKAAYVFPITH